jgi:hypothetical protein
VHPFINHKLDYLGSQDVELGCKGQKSGLFTSKKKDFYFLSEKHPGSLQMLIKKIKPREKAVLHLWVMCILERVSIYTPELSRKMVEKLSTNVSCVMNITCIYLRAECLNIYMYERERIYKEPSEKI